MEGILGSDDAQRDPGIKFVRIDYICVYIRGIYYPSSIMGCKCYGWTWFMWFWRILKQLKEKLCGWKGWKMFWATKSLSNGVQWVLSYEESQY